MKNQEAVSLYIACQNIVKNHFDKDFTGFFPNDFITVINRNARLLKPVNDEYIEIQKDHWEAYKKDHDFDENNKDQVYLNEHNERFTTVINESKIVSEFLAESFDKEIIKSDCDPDTLILLAGDREFIEKYFFKF